MNKLLVLAMLCVASASCVELENICSSDAFEYDGVLVNAFHRVQWNVTFEPLSHYLINDSVECYYSQFENKTNYFEVLKIKHAYNRKFGRLFTEGLNGDNLDEIRAKSQDLHAVGGQPLYSIGYTEGGAKCIASFGQTISWGQGVIRLFESMIEYNYLPKSYYEDYKPTESDAIKAMETLMDELRSSADGQTFAFGTDSAYNVYVYKGIGLFKEFKFLREGSAGVGPETKSMLTYDLLLPFNNKNHDDRNCVALKDLTWFYKKMKNEF